MESAKNFGTCEKGTVTAYTLKNKNGMEVTILTFGGILQKIVLPVDGKPVDVCLGYDTLEEYLNGDGCFGALIGRNSNRIRGAAFSLNGKTYQLTANQKGGHQLHGGLEGFNRKNWQAEATENSVALTYFSKDGEEGFPGNVNVTVTYTLDDQNALSIDYRAESDQDTIVNMTNHCYFNLNGHGSGSAEGHTLQIFAEHYTVGDADIIPTGEIAEVAGTCMDFRQAKPMGRDIEDESLALTGGYDHNFCVDGTGLRKAAVLQGDRVCMETETTCPGIQLYTGNFLGEQKGKNGATYRTHGAICLETQAYPDAIHHANFPSPVLKKGELYHETTVYRFFW